MSIDFLTPRGALLAVLVLIPLGAFFGVSRHAAHLRRSLRLPELSLGRRLVPVAAVLAIGGLVGSAAAQPVLQHTTKLAMRSDAEAYMVFDISRSMLARRSAHDPTRLERAKAAATRFRAALPEVPVGIASLTNRVLPHLFPSPDQDVFRATLDEAIGIQRPPPGTSVLTAIQQALRSATNLGSLTALAAQHFYSPAARHRVAIVFTDGESPGVSSAAVGRRLRKAGIDIIFVQIREPGEKVFTRGIPEPNYRSDSEARSILDSLAAASHGSVYDEGDLDAAIHKAREDLGTGPTVVRAEQSAETPLAPYLAAAAFLPLALLFWRRDR